MLGLQQGRGHQDHHHDAGRQHPGQQHRQQHRRAVRAHHRLERQLLGQRLAQLQLGEHRGLVQPAAQVDRNQAEHPAEQEGHAPGPGGQLLGAEGAVDRAGGQRAEQDAGGEAGGQGAAGEADAPLGHVLGDEHPGPRHLAADRRALNHAQRQQCQRRPDADLRVGRQEAHAQGRHGHHEDAQAEHALAPEQVAEVGHDDAAQGPRQVAGGEDAEGLQLAQPVGHLGGEEQLADHCCEEHEDDEVVELQRAAQGGEREGLEVAAAQGARRGRAAGMLGGHGWFLGDGA